MVKCAAGRGNLQSDELTFVCVVVRLVLTVVPELTRAQPRVVHRVTLVLPLQVAKVHTALARIRVHTLCLALPIHRLSVVTPPTHETLLGEEVDDDQCADLGQVVWDEGQ